MLPVIIFVKVTDCAKAVPGHCHGQDRGGDQKFNIGFHRVFHFAEPVEFRPSSYCYSVLSQMLQVRSLAPDMSRA